jgi:hypothetical protein
LLHCNSSPAGTLRVGLIQALDLAKMNDSANEKSKRAAGLVGPSLMVIVTAELPFVQPGLYVGQTAVGVYVSGALFFVAGLALVQAHNIWERTWRVLVTICGWSFLGLGIMRLFTATSYVQAASSVPNQAYVVLQLLLIGLGAFLTYKAFGKS